MRDQVGRKIQFTPGEVERYFEEHKQEYAQPESVRLSEILIAGQRRRRRSAERSGDPCGSTGQIGRH